MAFHKRQQLCASHYRFSNLGEPSQARVSVYCELHPFISTALAIKQKTQSYFRASPGPRSKPRILPRHQRLAQSYAIPSCNPLLLHVTYFAVSSFQHLYSTRPILFQYYFILNRCQGTLLALSCNLLPDHMKCALLMKGLRPDTGIDRVYLMIVAHVAAV